MPLNPIICRSVVWIINLQPAEFLWRQDPRSSSLVLFAQQYWGSADHNRGLLQHPSAQHPSAPHLASLMKDVFLYSWVWCLMVTAFVLQRRCFVVHRSPKNNWIQPDCWCIFQGLLCVLFMKNRKRALSTGKLAVAQKGVLDGFYFLSMKQFIVLQFSKAAWLLICFRL